MLTLTLDLVFNAAIMFCCALCLYLLCTGGAAACLNDDIKRRDYREVFSTVTMFVIVFSACLYQSKEMCLALFKLATPIMKDLMIGGVL